MKRTLFTLLTIVVALCAVQWNVVNVPIEGDPEANPSPLIVVDGQGKVRIVYDCWDGTEEIWNTKLASNASGSWVNKDVGNAYANYSIAIDAHGNTFVAFIADSLGTGSEQSDMFFADDSSGTFVAEQLTNDAGWQGAPTVKLDDQATAHLVFHEGTQSALRLMYGCNNNQGFKREVVSFNRNDDYYHSIDLVLDKEGSPHVFFIGDDDCIYHADRTGGEWTEERINDVASSELSADIDTFGYFHVAYVEDNEVLHYINNWRGTWHDEVVTTPDGFHSEPCIAVDKNRNPHIAWLYFWDTGMNPKICYVTKKSNQWEWEEVTSSSEFGTWPGTGHFFILDDEDYGYLVHDNFNMENMPPKFEVHYRKSKEPLTGEWVAYTEQPLTDSPFDLEIRGSTVCFSLPQPSSLRLDLYDATGSRVEVIASGYYSSGEHSIPLDTRNTDGLSRGVYFVRAQIGGQSASAKFVVTR